MPALGLRLWDVLNFASSRSDVRLKNAAERAAFQMVERLEPRTLLSFTTAQLVYNWIHLRPGFRHDLAVLEYQNPDFLADVNAGLKQLGVPLITPLAPAAPANSSAKGSRHPRPHKPVIHAAHPKPEHVHTRRPRRHVRGNGPMVKADPGSNGPTVTGSNFSYATLPETLTFTLSEDVSASVTAAGLAAVNVVNTLTNQVYQPTTITADSASQTVTIGFGNTPMPMGKYQASLLGSKISDSSGNPLIGSDGIAGHDATANFYYIQGDFNGDGAVDFNDMSILSQYYNQAGNYTQGDANYDGQVNSTDFADLTANYDTSFNIAVPSFSQNPTTTVNSVLLSWAETDPTVTQYTVLRTNSDGTNPTSFQYLPSTSFQDSGLTAGATYAYKIEGVNSNRVHSVWSQPFLVTLPPASSAPAGYSTAAPQPPTALQASTGTGSAQDNTISLSWAPSTTPGVTYEIDRNGQAIGSTTGTSFTDTGLDANTSYTYSLFSVDSTFNKSAAATVIHSTGADVTKPNVPLDLEVSNATSSSVSLSWVQPSDNVGVTSYQITRSPSFSGGGTMTTNETSFTDSGLTAGTSYTYKISALDQAQNQSSQASITTVTPGGSQTPTDSSPNQYIPTDWQNDFYNNLTAVLRQRLAAIPTGAITPPAARYWYDSRDTLISGTFPGLGQTQIKGSEGTYDYVDATGVGHYVYGDTVWLDTNQDHVYQTGETIVAPHGATLTPGTWGKTNGICSALVNGSTVVWADSNTDFTTDFAAFYTALDSVLPYYSPTVTSDMHAQDDVPDLNNPSNDVWSVGSLLAAMPTAPGSTPPSSVTIPNDSINVPSSNTTVTTVTDTAGTLTKELVSGDSIQLNGSWYSITSFTDTQITLATPYVGPAIASTPLVVRNWTLVPSIQDSDTNTTFQYERGIPAAGDLIFQQQFDELHWAVSQLNQVAPFYDETDFGVTRSNHFLTVAGEVLNAYESVFGVSSDTSSDDYTLRTQLLNGGASVGATEQSEQIIELRNMVTALEGAIYERNGSGGFATDPSTGQPITFSQDSNWLSAELPQKVNADNNNIIVRQAGSWSDDALGNSLGAGSLIDPEHLNEIERVLKAMTTGPVDPGTNQPTTDQSLWISMGSGRSLTAKITSANATGNEQGDTVKDAVYSSPPSPTKWPSETSNFIVGSTATGTNPIIAVGNLGFARSATTEPNLNSYFASYDYTAGTVTTVLPAATNPNGGANVTTVALGPSPVAINPTGWQWGTTATVFSWSQSDVQSMLMSNGWPPPDPGLPPANQNNDVYLPGPSGVWGDQGAFQWQLHYSVSADMYGNYKGDVYNEDVRVNMTSPSLFGKVPLGSTFAVPSPTTDGPDGSGGRPYPGGSGWTAGSQVAPEPTTTLPLTSEMDYKNVVADSNLDGIVQVPVDLQSFGHDTGTMSFLATNDLPQIYIPVYTDPTGTLPINGYLVQGAFGDGTGTIGDLLNNNWQASGKTYEDANQDGLPYGYSLNTFIRPNLLINDSVNHIKRMEVIRPGGNAVVFDFPWDSATSDFSTIGTPMGWDGRDSSRTYVLRYDTDNAGNKQYQLEFTSGIIQTFNVPTATSGGTLKSVSDASGLTQTIGSSNLTYDATNHWLKDSTDSSRYTVTLKFQTDSQNNGFLNEADYQTIAQGSGPTQTITTNMGYGTGPDPTIISLDKNDGGEIPAFSYSLTGPSGNDSSNTQTISTNGVTLTRTGALNTDGSGDITITKSLPSDSSQVSASTAADEYLINSDGMITQDTYTLNEGSAGPTTTALTKYQYDTGERSQTNGSAPWGHVVQVTNPDGSWEAFQYDPNTGWMTEDVTPFKNSTWTSGSEGSQVVKYLDYDGTGYFESGDSTTEAFNGQAADTSNLVERPRLVMTETLGTITGEVLSKYAPVLDSNGNVQADQVISRTIPPDTAAYWSNGVFQTTNQITAYDAYNTTGPSGQTSQSVSIDSSHNITQTSSGSFGATTLSSQTLKINPFGQTLSGQNSAVGTPFTSDTSNAQDAFGRSTGDSVTGGITTGATFSNTGNLWFGPQTVTESDGSTTKYTYTPLGQMATKIIYAGTSHSIKYSYVYDAAGNVVSQTQTAVDGSGNPVAGLASITNTSQFDAMGHLTKEVDDTTGGDVTANRQTNYVYTDTANGVVEDITYPDGSSEEKITNLDGSPQSDTGTAVTSSTYNEGVVASDTMDANSKAESAGSTWTSVTSGGSSDTTTTFTNMLGEQYLTQQSTPTTASDGSISTPYSDITSQFDGNGRATQATAVDGTKTYTMYDPQTGQAEASWIDMNNNGVYDPGKDRKTIDRLSAATSDPSVAVGDDTQDLSSSGVADDNTTASEGGMDTSESVDGQTTSSATSVPAGGAYTKTTSNPDGTETVDTYTDGLLTDEKTLGTDHSFVITDTSYVYNGLRELTNKTDYTGTTNYTYFSDGTQATVQSPGHNAQAVQQVDQHSEATTQSTRSDGQTISTPRNYLGSVATQSGAGVLSATFGYDASGTGEMTSLTTYRSGTLGDQTTAANTAWAYDPATGQRASKTFADGSQDLYSYNAKGQLTDLEAPGLDFSSFTYNHGELYSASLEDATTGTVSTTIMSRDELGRPTVVTDQDNGKTTTESTTYNAQQQIATASFGAAGGAMLDYQYGPATGFTTTQEPGAIDTTTITGLPGEQAQPATGYSYNPTTKQLSSITVNGVTLTYQYLPNSNQVETMNVGPLSEQWLPDTSDNARIAWINASDMSNGNNLLQDMTFSGGYNQQDQRTDEWLVIVNAGTTTSTTNHYGYTYDPTHGDALTGVSVNGTPTYTYGFDGVGNFTSNNGITLSLGTANSVNEYSNLTYNGRGDLTNDGTDTYGYDAQDRLISATPNSPASGSQQAQYGYDSQGRRLWMDVYSWNTTSNSWQYSYSRHYLWDGNQLAAVLDQNNTLLEQYTYGPMGLAAVTDYPADPANPDPAAGVKTYIAVEDVHGNTVELIDPGSYATDSQPAVPASVAANFYYDPYGRLLASSGAAAGICIILGKGYMVDAVAPNIGFAPNPTSGQDRSIDWLTDTFMERDPAGEMQGGLNLEQAFAADPINKVDPSGNDSFDIQKEHYRDGSGNLHAVYAIYLNQTNWLGLASGNQLVNTYDINVDGSTAQMMGGEAGVDQNVYGIRDQLNAELSANGKAAALEVALHAVPYGTAADLTVQGKYKQAAGSALIDTGMALAPLGIGKAVDAVGATIRGATTTVTAVEEVGEAANSVRKVSLPVLNSPTCFTAGTPVLVVDVPAVPMAEARVAGTSSSAFVVRKAVIGAGVTIVLAGIGGWYYMDRKRRRSRSGAATEPDSCSEGDEGSEVDLGLVRSLLASAWAWECVLGLNLAPHMIQSLEAR